MTIRKAVVDDAVGVATVHVRSWQSAYRGIMPEEFLDQISIDARAEHWSSAIPSGNVWVALSEGDVVGFAAAGPSRDSDASFELYAIYFLPSAWGNGQAQPLAIEALGDERDVVVWVLEDNHRARSFYARLGFVADGVTKSEVVGTVELTEIRYRLRR
ncbi:GNAT family N-acetyltransferase [Lentzea alba]|uniref:GNAT family N-acetyltransferase n=1 Tax=Lentzea alba TaxID=2714351 RepID=UPI0039BF97B8